MVGLALAVALAAAPLAGCGEEPVAPLPVRQPAPSSPAGPATSPPNPTPAPSPPPSVAATTAATTAAAPTRPIAPPPTRPGRPSTAPTTGRPTGTPPAACLGAVRYDLVLAETELALFRSLCLATGGVLRIQGIGPGEVTVDREDLVVSNYEAGVVDIRFVRPGTVEVRIPQNGVTYPVVVVVR
ncbi:hypothetical protein D7223_27345 [Micromonospora endolithica]|uniref:Uncharacterized protein n=1 Tax=Micromonospora endolithica TaxID=230091 RepID=A0A3A9YW61_9ACTN|nr:hypothetical protein D7223_27345 [Micromonospora endolithica]TWJ22639.1 hypothetical protein JD76_02761 [Micromonospora endolithica]